MNIPIGTRVIVRTIMSGDKPGTYMGYVEYGKDEHVCKPHESVLLDSGITVWTHPHAIHEIEVSK